MRLFHQSVHPLQKELSVIAGPSSPDLAAKIAQDLGAELIPVDVRIFTDSESKIRMGNVKKKKLCYCSIDISSHRSTSFANTNDDQKMY